MKKVNSKKIRKIAARMRKLETSGKLKKLDKLIARTDPNLVSEKQPPYLLDHFETTLLINLIARQATEAVKKLIAAGADVNLCTFNWETPLMFASQSGNAELAKILVEAGANINAHTYEGKTALGIAKKNGKTEVEKYLRSVGAKKEIDKTCHKKFEERTAEWYHIAVFNRQWGKIGQFSALYNFPDIFMDDFPEDINASDCLGYTVLHLASGAGILDIVNKIINLNADVNRSANDGKTALMLAANFRRNDIVHRLIANNANLNAQDKDGKTALHFILESYHYDLYQYESNEEYRKQNPFETVKALVTAGADINLQDKDGKTALMLALENGLFDVLPMLLDADVDASVCDNRKDSILAKAVALDFSSFRMEQHTLFHRFLEYVLTATGGRRVAWNSLTHRLLIHALIQVGANVNHRSGDGRTPLRIARDLNLFDVAQELIDHGARE